MDLLLAFFYIVLALLFLGVIVAFSPTLVITELTILTKSKKPFLHTVAFIAGIAVPVILISIITIVVINPGAEIDFPNIDEAIGPTPLLDLFVGTLFIYAGLKFAKPKLDNQSRFDPEKLLNTKTLFWFGAIKMATSVSSLAAILYAASFLKANTTQSLQQFFGILWLMAVSILPFILIALSKWLSPNSFQRIQDYSDKVAEFNWRLIIAISMVILGIVLIISAILTIFN